jgi:hypothetical protein
MCISPQILTAADRWKASNAPSSDKSFLTNMESGSDSETCNRNDGREEEENNSGEMRDAKWWGESAAITCQLQLASLFNIGE